MKIISKVKTFHIIPLHVMWLPISEIMYKYVKFSISSADSQKGVIIIQRCSIENQNGGTAIDFVQ